MTSQYLQTLFQAALYALERKNKSKQEETRAGKKWLRKVQELRQIWRRKFPCLILKERRKGGDVPVTAINGQAPMCFIPSLSERALRRNCRRRIDPRSRRRSIGMPLYWMLRNNVPLLQCSAALPWEVSPKQRQSKPQERGKE